MANSDPMGLAGAYGSASIPQTLDDLVKQRYLQQQIALRMAEEQRQRQEMAQREQIAQQELGLRGRGLDLDERALGQRAQQFEAEAANRAASAAYQAALTRNLEHGMSQDDAQQAALDELAQREPKLAPVLKLFKAGVPTRPVDAFDPTGETEYGRELGVIREQGAQQRATDETRARLEAAGGSGTKPGGDITAGQKQELANWNALARVAQDALNFGESTKWEGVGWLVGPAGELKQKMVGDTQNAMDLRQKINQLLADLGKARGGTALTPQELALLKSYAPTTNESYKSIKTKLNGLIQFARIKEEELRRQYGQDMPGRMGTMDQAVSGATMPPTGSGKKRFTIVNVQPQAPQ